VGVLVTGVAGFIGYALAERLLVDGAQLVGVDNLSPYYDVTLKEARLARLKRHPGFRFERLDVADRQGMSRLFAGPRFATIVHLAAQAGVRYSLEQPLAYVDANLVGFGHILEGARAQRPDHLLFASSSSVYGGCRRLPFRETDRVDFPITLYAATKKANELAAHSYAHLFGLPSTGLRFFTVYGPWGRPDMALFKFTRAMLADEPLPVFNGGQMVRDFTFIDDVVEAIVRLIPRVPQPGEERDENGNSLTEAPYRVFNIGNGRPVELLDFIKAIERALRRTARLDPLPFQPGDMAATMADVTRLEAATGFRPRVTVEEGIPRFLEWYRGYYGARPPPR
jgi:UDP-glucuronate 4-epimerase